MKGDKASAAAEEIRNTYIKYMQEVAPASGQAKLDAVSEVFPADTDAGFMTMTVHVQVSMDAVIAAVALYLARHEII